MEFVDTHCHIHFPDYGLDAEDVLQRAKAEGVTRLLVVGCTLEDSVSGVVFAEKHKGVWAVVGIHPHEAHHYVNDAEAIEKLRALAEQESVVAIGECGLDYYYNHSPREAQIKMLEQQLQIAHNASLPIAFHVRDAFDDFFPIFDNFSGLKGVVHSFTAGVKVLDKVLERGLFVGLNGIMTFTKDEAQMEMARTVPLQSLLLETDAPFLTPVPHRGKICESRHVVDTARFLASLRDEKIEDVSRLTTQNAIKLFNLT